MKIICIGRNYVDHVQELKNEMPSEPVVFLKPETAILKNNSPFYYPKFSNEIHYEAELIVKICKEGKNIEEKFAHKYYNEIGVGIDFTARDIQAKAKKEGLPWTLAKGFNGSAPISNFFPIDDISKKQPIQFSLQLNDALKQQGNTKNMIFSIEAFISYVSRFITLKTGDILFTGTPAGVGPVKIGDRLEVFLEENSVLTCEVK